MTQTQEPSVPAVSPVRPPWRDVLLVLVAAFALLGWRMLEPLGRDQHVFYLIGREFWHGRMPYRDIFENKPPGILIVYAFAALLDGCDGWAIGLLDTLATGLTAACLLLFLRRSGNGRAGWFAAGIYLLCSRTPYFGGWWGTGQPETFQDLAVGILLIAGQANAWRWAGAAVFAALTLKFTYIGLVPVALWWAGRRNVLAFFTGMAIPLLIGVVATAATGVLGPMIDASVLFNFHYASKIGLTWAQIPRQLGYMLLIASVELPTAIVGALAGAPRWRTRDGALMLGIFLAAFAQLLVQRKLFAWHPIPLMLPIAVWAGVFWASRPRWVLLLFGLLTVPTLFTLQGAATTRLAGGTRAEVLSRYTWGNGDFSALEVAATGTWVASQARSTDKMLVWGFEPGVFVTSGLSPATRWIYDFPLTVVFKGAEREAALADVVAKLPATRWIVIFRNDRNPIERQDSMTQWQQIPVLRDVLAADYEPVKEIGDATIFRRKAPSP